MQVLDLKLYMKAFFLVDRFLWRCTKWVTRLLFVFARFQYSTWQFRCVSGFGLSCLSVNETVAGSSHIVPSTSASPSAARPASVSENSVNLSIAANLTAGLLVAPSERLSATLIPSLSVTQTEILSVAQVPSSAVSMNGRISVTLRQNSSVTQIVSATQVPRLSVSMDGRISVTLTQNSSVTQSTSSPSRMTLEASVSVNRRSSVNNTGTRQYEPRFQYFMITSSVVFIKVPAEKPPRVKR